MFSFKVKVDNLDGAVTSAKREIKKVGGSFHGDEHGGSFSGKGVSGKYQRVDDHKVKVTITSKPFFASESMVENAIRGFFAA